MLAASPGAAQTAPQPDKRRRRRKLERQSSADQGAGSTAEAARQTSKSRTSRRRRLRRRTRQRNATRPLRPRRGIPTTPLNAASPTSASRLGLTGRRNAGNGRSRHSADDAGSGLPDHHRDRARRGRRIVRRFRRRAGRISRCEASRFGEVKRLYNGIWTGPSDITSRWMDTSNLDQVEFLKGPSSLMTGLNAIGGSVNYVSRQPTSGPMQNETDFSVRFTRLGPLAFRLRRQHAGAGSRLSLRHERDRKSTASSTAITGI